MEVSDTPLKTMFLTFDWNVPATVEQNVRPQQPNQQNQRTPLHPPISSTVTHRTPLRRTVIEVEVAEEYEREADEEGVAWVMNTAPRHWMARSLIVRLTSKASDRGSGRLTMITRMTRHWVSFKVHGITPLTSLRVPIVWTKLSPVDQYEHMTRYASLSPLPRPLPNTVTMEEDGDGVTSPYDYEVTATDRYLERQLALRHAGQVGRA